MNFLYGIFAVTIFLSSFLLFQVQPLLGKHILPWFGGSSAVWVSAMLFFMVALAAGYIYAMYLSRLKLWYQVIVHIGVIIISVILIKSHLASWSSAITPDLSDLALNFSDPVLAVFKTLLITIGLPFALLSSTSSLLQVWYGNLSGKEPFSLYSISNVGSLLGLLSYPLFFERFFSTHTQGEWWTYGFITYVGLLLLIIYILLILKKPTVNKVVINDLESAPSTKQLLIWTSIASVPVMTMLAGTTFMTSSIAPVPFLWVGPLALYLISFIITFRSGARLPLWVNELLVLLFALLTILLIVVLSTSANVVLLMIMMHLTLFTIYHWCHEYLYALRPKAEHLTSFYVALSIGGIVGSLLIKLSTSYILVLPIELLIILVLSVAFIAYKFFTYQAPPILSQKQIKSLASVVLISTLVIGILYINKFQDDTLNQERNFFGYKAVRDKTMEDERRIMLQHGMTNHGYQIYLDNEPQILPVSYYGSSAGVGKAFSYLRSRNLEKPKVAIAGLGSGGLLAYCQPEDEFTIFEIDPDVYTLAKENFTYLKHCPKAEVIISDARLAFADINKNNQEIYNLIILDAYADDMMPIHLLTVEAMKTYKDLLVEDGVIAVNISSRYLDLLPVLGALADTNNLSVRYLFDKKPATYGVASVWVLLAKDEDIFAHETFSGLSDFSQVEKRVLWTDTYSALLPIVRMGNR
jgi:16S rRNA G966 N2-methylase RsmD